MATTPKRNSKGQFVKGSKSAAKPRTKPKAKGKSKRKTKKKG